MKPPSSALTAPHILAGELSSLVALPQDEQINALRADQERRWLKGDRMLAEYYRAAVPLLQTEVEIWLDLIYNEFLLRQRLGEQPTPEEYLRRFPEHASILRLLLKIDGEPGSPPGRYPEAGRPLPPWSCLEPPQAPGELGRLGGYRIFRLLGEGGMGIVLEAEDPDLNRRIALKVMQPRYAGDPAYRQRFLREARHVARVKNDHVVTVHRVGEAGGVPYLAMELLAGESLAAHLRRRTRLPWPEVVLIGLETARGLAAAHQQGLIHRDIKPGNIWLEDRNAALSAGEGGEAEEARVKILDFGLARILEGEETLTRSGVVMGTPAYMAPEQAAAQDVDARADLFSLGCVLYELLTGSRPFQGGSTLAILQQLAVHQPPSPAQLQPEVPAALSSLVEQLLAKDREQRPASAAAVIAALQAIEAEQSSPEGRQTSRASPPPLPSAAPPSDGATTPWIKQPSRSLVPGRRGLLLAGSVAALLLGSGALWHFLPRFVPGSRDPDQKPTTSLPLDGDLLVRIYSKDGQKRGLLIGRDDALPARQGELLHLEAQLNQPAHVYMLWVDGKGVVTPLYPWNHETFDVKSLRDAPLPEQPPRALVESPGGGKSPGWRIDNTPGLDTIVLLARKQPLPAGFDLAARIGPMPPAPLDPRNPKEVVIRGFSNGKEDPKAKLDIDRAPEALEQINDQLLRLMDRVKDDFELIRVVGFAHAKR